MKRDISQILTLPYIVPFDSITPYIGGPEPRFQGVPIYNGVIMGHKTSHTAPFQAQVSIHAALRK